MCTYLRDKTLNSEYYDNTFMGGYQALKFDYEVMKNPNNVDTQTENFRHKIGDILVEVMEEQLKNGKLSIINK